MGIAAAHQTVLQVQKRRAEVGFRNGSAAPLFLHKADMQTETVPLLRRGRSLGLPPPGKVGSRISRCSADMTRS